MASIFNVFKYVRPRKTIKSDDFNGLQDALKASFDGLGSALTVLDPVGHLGVSSPFHVAEPVDNEHAATKLYVDTSYGSNAANLAAALAAQTAAEAAEAGADADLLATNQDTIDTAADAVSTAADRVQTGLDALATGADSTATAADLLATNQDTIDTAADAVATAADRVQTGLDALATAADAAATNQDAIDTAADLVATNQDTLDTAADAIAADSAATSAATSEVNAQLRAWEAEAEQLTSDSYATQVEDVFVNTYTSDGDGTFTATPTTEYSALHHAAKALGNVGYNSPTRNAALNQDPVSQGESTRTGMSSTIYTGNGTGQSVATGVDMATGDFGGLVWVKDRTATYSHSLTDTVRGLAAGHIRSDDTISGLIGVHLSSFDSNGFTVDIDVAVNTNLNDYVAWAFQTNKKIEPTYGSELITNGIDWTGASGNTPPTGWTNTGTLVQFSVVGGALTINRNGETVGADATTSQTLTTVIGKVYEISFDVVSITSGNVVVDAGSDNNIGGSDATTGAKVYHFTADATSSLVSIRPNGSTGICEIDNFSVKEIANGAVTNRGKPYTCHYNTDMGFSIVGYVGDGVAGHEIPHHLGVEPELSIFKNRDVVDGWAVQSPYIGEQSEGNFLELNTTAASSTVTGLMNIYLDNTVSLNSGQKVNSSADNHISYHFASVPGVSKVGKYIGTGAAGNYVDCGFKPGFLLTKNLTTGATDWRVFDAIRGDTQYLFPNDSAVEVTGTPLSFVDSGFVLTTVGVELNSVNDEFIFLAFAETSSDATKAWTDYSYPTTADTLSLNQDTLLSFANGFSATGQLDTPENVGAGVTYALGVGHENKHYWLYKDKAGSYGVSEYRPLEGITRNDADKWGLESPLDASLRTPVRHFDYESSTGVVLASGEFSADYAWEAFRKAQHLADSGSWSIDTTGACWIQYKGTEKRILKSWRLRSSSLSARLPKRFTVEGSNDGLNWVAVDSTYTAVDYTPAGDSLWNDITSTAGNTTAYLYHRLNITANNGDVTYTQISELEFNTILPSDYYLIEEGVMRNSAGTPIERIYLAELMTDSGGDVSWFRNLPVATQKFSDVDVHKDLTVHGDIFNKGAATAWVNFDGTQDPPLIRSSYNIKDVVDLGTGHFKLIFETPMDRNDYVGAGMVNTSTGGSSLSAVGVVTDGATTQSVEVDTSYVTSTVNKTNTDKSNTLIQIFGGKD